MIKIILISTILNFALTYMSFSQEPIKYQSKCKEFGHIRKYTCVQLLLNPDHTFHYEEIAGDLPMIFENGPYSWSNDSLSLKTKEHGTIKYLKRKSFLLPLNKTKTQSFKDKLQLDKQRAKT
jgi:hypothetical protein